MFHDHFYIIILEPKVSQAPQEKKKKEKTQKNIKTGILTI